MKMMIYVVAGFFAILSGAAHGGVVQTIGAGSAVTSVDRLATFDVLGTSAQPSTLLGYTEDQIIVSVDDSPFGFPGSHYGISGNQSFVTIAASDGIDMYGVEALVYSGHQGGGVLVWQALKNGIETGAGLLPGIDGYGNISNTIYGWHDSQGFDELRLSVVINNGAPVFGSYQAIALDHVAVQTGLSVPLPATLPILLLGFGFIALASSRRRFSTV